MNDPQQEKPSPPADLSRDDLVLFMTDDRVAIAARQRNVLRSIREFDARKLWETDGCRNMGQWLAPRFGISVSAGMRWTHAAHALERLPVIAAAFERATISLEQVVELCRFATPETERDLLRYARRASLNALRRRANIATRPALDDHANNHHARFLEWRTVNDAGAIYVEALFPAEEGAIVTKALRRIADQLPQMPPLEQRVPEVEVPEWAGLDANRLPAETIEIRDGIHQRFADALVALAAGHMTAARREWSKQPRSRDLGMHHTATIAGWWISTNDNGPGGSAQTEAATPQRLQ